MQMKRKNIFLKFRA